MSKQALDPFLPAMSLKALDAQDLVMLEIVSTQHIRVIVYGAEEEDAVDGIEHCGDFASLHSTRGMALLKDALTLHKS